MIKGIRGIHHTAMSVPNLEQAMEFYVDKVGMELVAPFDFDDDPELDQVLDLKHAAARSCMLRAGNLHLEIWEYSNPTPNLRIPTARFVIMGTRTCVSMSVWRNRSQFISNSKKPA